MNIFKDYYKILKIPPESTFDEVKVAYHSASKKWHPDFNKKIDTTQIMQDINEAYAILKDEKKRHRYNTEYFLFKNVSIKSTTTDNLYSYDIQDEHLKEDIQQARAYAKNLVDEFLREFRNSSKNAVKGWWEESIKVFKIFIISTTVATLLVALARL